MGPELRELARNPVGLGALEEPTHAASGENPVCGDRVVIEACVENGRIRELGFRATACPACVAVASCAVEVAVGAELPIPTPSSGLRARIDERGGLTRFEQHALALVEDVLARLSPTS